MTRKPQNNCSKAIFFKYQKRINDILVKIICRAPITTLYKFKAQ